MTDEQVMRLTDEDGQEADFRQLCRFDLHGQTYVALEDLEDEESVILFRVSADEDGEELYDEDEGAL